LRARVEVPPAVDPGTPSFERTVAALGPWWFRFEHHGMSFGGTVERDREKTAWFFECLARSGAPPLRTVLELGAHEGSHSLQLADCPSVESVVALEGRRATLARAAFAKRVFQDRKIVFRKYDIERLDPADFPEPFDAVFCAGLLYHLPRPWRLIERLPALTRRLFLDTHYAASQETAVEGHAGRWFVEGRDPLSGLSPSSFWLTFDDLVRTLEQNGFAVRWVRDMKEFPKGPRAFLFAESAASAGGPSPPSPPPGD
jgi:hypothetical protein